MHAFSSAVQPLLWMPGDSGTECMHTRIQYLDLAYFYIMLIALLLPMGIHGALKMIHEGES